MILTINKYHVKNYFKNTVKLNRIITRIFSYNNNTSLKIIKRNQDPNAKLYNPGVGKNKMQHKEIVHTTGLSESVMEF